VQKDTKNERDVLRIMIWGSAVAFGFLAAALQALRPRPAGFTFNISALTWLAFILGTGVGVIFWKIVLSRAGGAREKRVRFVIELVLLLLGAAAFLYPLRFVPSEKLPELLIGLVTAAVALSIVAGLLIMMGRFLGSDEKKNRLDAHEGKDSRDHGH